MMRIKTILLRIVLSGLPEIIGQVEISKLYNTSIHIKKKDYLFEMDNAQILFICKFVLKGYAIYKLRKMVN